ncbi:MAG: dodecin domain-containing protein [Actinomycetia bacterium]|nr:dodecin domain-containing protein [Actinomycetes bacterium]
MADAAASPTTGRGVGGLAEVIGGTRPGSVHKVIKVVGTHPDSWEAAAQVAVDEAARTIRDLHHAKVTELDTLIDDDGIIRFRAKLQLAFQVDRMRPADEPGHRDVEVTRHLIVANRTLDSDALTAEVGRLAAQGAAEFHVLVPAVYTDNEATARRLAFVSDPISGYVMPDPSLFTRDDEAARQRALERLDRHLETIRAEGSRATGEIGDADPFHAIMAVMERGSFDHIVLATLPPGLSRIVHMDLPSRVKRAVPIPLTHIITEPLESDD